MRGHTKSSIATANLPCGSSRLDVRLLADRFDLPREIQCQARPRELRASGNELWLRQLPAPKPALDSPYPKAPCSASAIFLRAQRGAALTNRKRFAKFAP